MFHYIGFIDTFTLLIKFLANLHVSLYRRYRQGQIIYFNRIKFTRYIVYMYRRIQTRHYAMLVNLRISPRPSWQVQLACFNPFLSTVPTFAVWETDVFRHNGGNSGAPIMPRDVSLSDSKCWNGGQKLVAKTQRWAHSERLELLWSSLKLCLIFFFISTEMGGPHVITELFPCLI